MLQLDQVGQELYQQLNQQLNRVSRSDPTFDSDFSEIFYNPKNVLWWDLSHIQNADNLCLTKIGWDFTVKNRDLGHPTTESTTELKTESPTTSTTTESTTDESTTGDIGGGNGGSIAATSIALLVFLPFIMT